MKILGYTKEELWAMDVDSLRGILHERTHQTIEVKEVKMKSKAVIALAIVLTVVALGQIILSFVLYNRYGNPLLRNAGWAVLCISAIFGWLPIFTFRKKGGVSKGKGYTHTTMLVDSGIYAIVRHPQYLGFILFVLGLVLISQHWLSATSGAAGSVLFYMDVGKEEETNIEKFGDDYRRYMEKVPRMNVVVGAMRLLRRSRKG